jgi:hypothetical protein
MFLRIWIRHFPKFFPFLVVALLTRKCILSLIIDSFSDESYCICSNFLSLCSFWHSLVFGFQFGHIHICADCTLSIAGRDEGRQAMLRYSSVILWLGQLIWLGGGKRVITHYRWWWMRQRGSPLCQMIAFLWLLWSPDVSWPGVLSSLTGLLVSSQHQQSLYVTYLCFLGKI